MGYATRQEVILALANALSMGNPSTPGTLVDITSVGSTISDSVTEAQLNQYIRWGDQQIDGALSALYRTPLRRVNRGTFRLALNATAGDTQIILEDATRLTEGDAILIRDTVNSQQVTVSGILDDNQVTLATPLLHSFDLLDTAVESIRYPDPVPYISARFAAATLYDRHFASQVQGNQSDFGKYLRRLAFDNLNLVLSGAVRLELADAGDYTGKRYYNQALDNTVKLMDEKKEYFTAES